MHTRRAGKLVLVAIISTLAAVLSAAPQPQHDTWLAQSATPGAPGAGDPYYPRDGNGGYDALSYDLSISYDPKTKHLDGDNTMRARAKHGLSRFNLDLRGLTVDSVEVDGRQASFRREREFELSITPAKPIAAGAEFTVRVRYAGTPGSESVPGPAVSRHGWQYSSTGGAFVLGEPHSASFWYPLNDTPRDKATFKLTARVPRPWVAVAGGREGPRTTEGGWSTFTWYDTNPAAGYLTTVAIDKFKLDRSTLPDGTPVVDAYAPGTEDKRSVEAELPLIMRILTRKFGPYPQTAAGGIFLNASIPYALEIQGRPVYPQWATNQVLVHEYAHQWFGNSVSVDSWSDMCLNECLASYAQWLWAEATLDADLDEDYREIIEVLGDAKFIWSPKLTEMGRGNEFKGVYSKGILAMHALRRKIGDPAFDAVLKEWPARHRNGNASWREFERFVDARTDVALDAFLDAWFRGEGRPPTEHLYPGSLRP